MSEVYVLHVNSATTINMYMYFVFDVFEHAKSLLIITWMEKKVVEKASLLLPLPLASAIGWLHLVRLLAATDHWLLSHRLRLWGREATPGKTSLTFLLSLTLRKSTPTTLRRHMTTKSTVRSMNRPSIRQQRLYDIKSNLVHSKGKGWGDLMHSILIQLPTELKSKQSVFCWMLLLPHSQTRL